VPTLEEHKLQLVRQRFEGTLPWFERSTRAKVALRSSTVGGSFTLCATWVGGTHEKTYTVATIRDVGRRGCTKWLAEQFVREVLLKQGEEPDE